MEFDTPEGISPAPREAALPPASRQPLSAAPATASRIATATETGGPLSGDETKSGTVRGLERPTVPAKAPPPMPLPRRTTQEDIRTAQADPLVRQALDLFGGSIVDVKPHRQMPAASIESDSDEVESTNQEP